MLTKDHAICIRAVDYSETSQIVTLFTKQNGKIGAIAKGSKRPKSSFDGPIELFAYGRIIFTHSDDAILAMDFSDWKPELRVRKSKEERAAEALKGMTPDQIKAALALLEAE